MGRGETKASSVDSLPDGDRGVHSLSPITGKDHPLSLILGLALVALVLIVCHIETRMTTSFVIGVTLVVFAFFGERAS